MQNTIDEVGNRYGSLRVIAPAASLGHGARWLCRCDCGGTRVVSGHALRRGSTRYCTACAAKARRRDLTGQRFGSWTVLGEAESRKGMTRWLCRCDCGRTDVVMGKNLMSGLSTRCSQHHAFDLEGMRFGSWTVLRKATQEKVRYYAGKGLYWLCRCDCGRERIVFGSSLRLGKTRSCGCGKRMRRRRDGQRGKTTPEGEGATVP